MAAPLTWKPIDGGLAVIGRIDENAELSQLAADLPLTQPLDDAPVRLDLSGLTRINSIGVREWMDFVASVASRPIALYRCAPVFVEQMNAIANFVGNATVASVLTSFECENDSSVTNVEVLSSEARAGKLPTAPRCATCGATMVPAVEDELYYRFLHYTK